MNTIHIQTADGMSAPYEESQVRAMLKQGLLRPETLYRMEGMSQWRPLRELPALPADAAAPAAGARYSFTKNPEPLTTVLEVMLVIYLLVTGFNLLLSIAALVCALLEDFTTGTAIAQVMRISSILSLLVFICTAVPFGMWIHRANLNCRGFGANLTFSPGMAIGCFFIPLANLVYPCQAMLEIWKASRNPVDWRSERGSCLVGFWWAFWLMTSILGLCAYHFSRTSANGLEAIASKLRTLFWLLIATEISKIILCVLAFALVYLITGRQKKLTAATPRQVSTPIF